MLLVDTYTFQSEHPFFEQALQLYAAAVLHTIIQMPGSPAMWIKDGHWRLELHGLSEFEACIREHRIPTEISVRPTFWTEWFPEEAARARAEDPPKPVPAGGLINTAAIFGLSHAYESHREWLVARFGAALPGAWPPDLQLFRHIRNACSHGNRFEIRLNRDRSDPIDGTNPPRWEDLVMVSREALHGSVAVGEFLPIAFVFPFLHDIGHRLMEFGYRRAAVP